MRITSLVENISNTDLRAKHGLALYIETKQHKILFDLGPDHTLFDNAKRRNIDLSEIDTVIISHGHMDHGGALAQFLNVNSTAKIYIQRSAFYPHYNKVLFLKVPVGLEKQLQTRKQVILLDGDYVIDSELSLFTVNETNKCYSLMNDVLYEGDKKDAFSHEQNLIITEDKTALIMGCGHAGVVNIMDKARTYQPDICVGGFHLFNPITKKNVPAMLLDDIAAELQKYKNTDFYTCHCTGRKAFRYLSREMKNLHYISCGEMIGI